jgi:hypothetical protein
MPNLVNDDCDIIVVDPNPLPEYINRNNTTVIESTAVGSLEELNEWF